MKFAWDGYREKGWSWNEVRPISGKGYSAAVFGNSKTGATVVDALDTLWIMGLTDEFKEGISFFLKICKNLFLENGEFEMEIRKIRTSIPRVLERVIFFFKSFSTFFSKFSFFFQIFQNLQLFFQNLLFFFQIFKNLQLIFQKFLFFQYFLFFSKAVKIWNVFFKIVYFSEFSIFSNPSICILFFFFQNLQLFFYFFQNLLFLIFFSAWKTFSLHYKFFSENFLILIFSKQFYKIHHHFRKRLGCQQFCFQLRYWRIGIWNCNSFRWRIFGGRRLERRQDVLR